MIWSRETRRNEKAEQKDAQKHGETSFFKEHFLKP